MSGGLRPEEQYVISVLAEAFNGTWRAGENPPDAYLMMGPTTVAVEISTLAQQVWGGGNGSRSRHSDDVPAERLANQLNNELDTVIPNGWMAILTLRSPITQVRKVKPLLKNKIAALVGKPIDGTTEEEILENRISIHITRDESGVHKKVVGLIPNRFSNPNILLNARIILQDRIETKTKKCGAIRGPLWLALFNDYFLADEDSYRVALSRMSCSHPFARIVIVGRNRCVTTLFDLQQ